MMDVRFDFTKFDPAITALLEHEAPDRAHQAVTRVARAIAREFRLASPVGGPPNPTRAAWRAKKPGVYGPLRRGWRTSAAKANARSFRFSRHTRYMLPPHSAAVFVKTFYAPLVDAGTIRASAHPFVQAVVDRAGSIAESELRSFLGG